MSHTLSRDNPKPPGSSSADKGNQNSFFLKKKPNKTKPKDKKAEGKKRGGKSSQKSELRLSEFPPPPRILKDWDKGKRAAPGMRQLRDVTLGQGRSKKVLKLGFWGAQGGVWVKRNPRMAQAEIPKVSGVRETEEEEAQGCW